MGGGEKQGMTKSQLRIASQGNDDVIICYANYLLTGASINNSLTPELLWTKVPSFKTATLKELLVVQNLMSPINSYFGKKKKVLFHLNRMIARIKFESIPIGHFHDITEKESRVDYINNLNGFLNNATFNSELNFHARYVNKPLHLKMPKDRVYKAVISTSPLPLKGNKIPLIQTLHDIIPVSTHFHSATLSELKCFNNKYKQMLSYSDRVLSVSDYSRQEILNYFPGYENKI